jgi:hypothetical protein
LNGSSSTIREGTWPFMKDSWSILLAVSPHANYWRKFFHDKRRNLTIYEKHPVVVIGTESWWNYWRGARPREDKELESLRKDSARFYWHRVMMTFIQGSSSTKTEGTWLFTKGSRSILLARSSDGIYWMKALRR